MAARPPSNDIDDEPDIVEFGIVELDAAVEDWNVSFPTSARTLEKNYGDEEVTVDPAGHTMTLDEALSRCHRDTFNDKQDLLNALHPVFESERERLSNSLLKQLRALLPF